ncbi:GNAT family N-acetyltransferase [Spirillospora sp. CA-255316]
MPDLRMRHFDSGQAGEIFEPLVHLQREVYGESDRVFDSEDRYRRQLSGHMTAPGFELVAAYLVGEMVGYVYGFPLPENARWWRGLLTPLPAEMTAETGKRTFALCELMVRPRHQGRSFGHALHDELLTHRSEQRATLLADPEKAAHGHYLRWGWQVIGQLRPSWEGSPTFDALILPLPFSKRPSGSSGAV